MAKQKVVIKVTLDSKRACKKAICAAVCIDGVIGAELVKDKNQIAVTGNNMDVVLLATKLRKALKHAVIETVSVVDETKKNIITENKDNNEMHQVMACSYNQYYHGLAHHRRPQTYYYIAEPCYNDYNGRPSCSIM